MAESIHTGSHVFLSYASADRERAVAIADTLEAKGVTVWIDRKSIAGGTSWSAEIVRGIESCSALLVLCSTVSARSRNVQQEVQLAWERDRPILPLLLENVRMPPAMEYALAGRQWVEILDRTEESWLPALLRALTGLGIGVSGDEPRPRPIPAFAEASRPVDQAYVPGTRHPLADSASHNLPAPVTSFIGRERELAQVRELLGTTRLLTLTGTGGCGKTRLSLQVAEAVLADYPDGVWLVELAPLASGELVASTVAAAIGVREGPGQPILTTLLSVLRKRRLLIVLDNCEHLIADCARLVDALLRVCPGVQILATSREALGIAGEVAWRVPSLGVGDGRSDQRALNPADSDAVRLFEARAKSVQSAFALTSANAPLIAQICRRLDGIPLAIELAAARVKALSLEQISARLDQRFRLLTGGSRAALPRQQTLAALVGWSYDLLTETERTLFNRLSVFAGGFTLEAAEAVCGEVSGIGFRVSGDEAVSPDTRNPIPDTYDVLDLLGSLVDKSLVIADEGADGAVRYRLLETLRQYGREKLLATGEADAIHRRHAAYFLRWTEATSRHLLDREQLRARQRLDADFDNIRAALRWLIDIGDAQSGFRLIDATSVYWDFGGMLREVGDWLRGLCALETADSPTPLRTRALITAGILDRLVGDVTRARTQAELGLALAREAGDVFGEASAIFQLSVLASAKDANPLMVESLRLLRQVDPSSNRAKVVLLHLTRNTFNIGDLPRAMSYLDEILAGAERDGDRYRRGWALEIRGEVTINSDPVSARRDLTESLRRYRELDNQAGIVSVENLIGRLELTQGNLDEARRYYSASLRQTRDWGWLLRIAQSLDGLASVAAAEGQAVRAMRLAGASSQWHHTVEGFELAEERAEYERALTPIRQSGDPAALAAWEEGRRMTIDEAIALALDESTDVSPDLSRS
jgi:predicted ATPase